MKEYLVMKNKVVFKYCVTDELIKNVTSFLIIFLVVSFSFGSPAYSQQRQFSPEFISLMTQVQQMYLAPRGVTIGMLENQAPASLATVIGHALRQQWPYIQQNPSLQNSFVNLQYEVIGYLDEVAKITRDPGPRGQGVTGDMLWNLTSRAMQGHDDNWVWKNYGVQPGTMPSIFAGGPGTQPPQSFLKPPFVEPEPQKPRDRLDLLGVSPQNVPQDVPYQPPRDKPVDPKQGKAVLSIFKSDGVMQSDHGSRGKEWYWDIYIKNTGNIMAKCTHYKYWNVRGDGTAYESLKIEKTSGGIP